MKKRTLLEIFLGKKPAEGRVPLIQSDIDMIQSVVGKTWTDGGDVIGKPVWNIYAHSKSESMGRHAFGKEDGKYFITLSYYEYGADPSNPKTRPLFNDFKIFENAEQLNEIISNLVVNAKPSASKFKLR